MKSMTGYGRGECARDGFKVTVELSSVNRRQSEIVAYLPRELEALEPRVRDEINRRIARGRRTLRTRATERSPGPGLRAGVEPPGQGTEAGGASESGNTRSRVGSAADRPGLDRRRDVLAGGRKGIEE